MVEETEQLIDNSKEKIGTNYKIYKQNIQMIQ